MGNLQDIVIESEKTAAQQQNGESPPNATIAPSTGQLRTANIFPNFDVNHYSPIVALSQLTEPVQLDFLADAHDQLRPPKQSHAQFGDALRITANSLRNSSMPTIRELGAYPDVNTYLRTHLQLLHDDFFSALKEGLAQLRAQQNDVVFKAGHFESNDKFWVYANKCIEVFVDTSKTTKCKLVVYLTDEENRNVIRSNLDTPSASAKQNGNVPLVGEVNDDELDNNVSFMKGSLLLFTTDVLHMDDVVLATVVRQHLTNLPKHTKDDAPNLRQRPHIEIAIVRVFSHANASVDNFLGKPMHMLECKDYFDPYYNIHRKLGSLTHDTFPFAQQILHASQQPQLPTYLEKLSSKDAVYYTRSEFHSLPLVPASAVWPAAEELGYNESQLAAIRHALTHRMAMIQGPPGTGKSFVGRELVSLLLHNARDYPRIVVVCNSNQALDQFMCALFEHTAYGNALVRMGGQCGEQDRIGSILERVGPERVLAQEKWRAFEDVSLCNRRVMSMLRESSKVDVAKLNELLISCTETHLKLDAVHQAGKFERFKDRRVFGMTSSFAAKNVTFLRSLKAQIVIVEEAAEMLEAHVVASLTEYTEHLIQIGDHKQLRPRCLFVASASDRHMDVSLFERLHNNGLPSVALTKQHRQFATLADLIRPSIYPVLTDAAAVADFPEIRGMPGRLCFMHHGFLERAAGTSKCNPGEAQMVRATCAYLLQQGYKPDDIAVLCTYKAQLPLLETGARGSKLCYGCRVAVVDSFQGREARIVLVSLVRNNSDGLVGFMATANRACVALSRAREGLYLFGNLQQLAVKSNVWSHVLRRLASEQYGIGSKTLVLQCDRHGHQTTIKVSQDFQRLAPFGGCAMPCTFALACGHLCEKQCHGLAMEHQCTEPCRYRVPKCGHKCVKAGCQHEVHMCQVQMCQVKNHRTP